MSTTNNYSKGVMQVCPNLAIAAGLDNECNTHKVRCLAADKTPQRVSCS